VKGKVREGKVMTRAVEVETFQSAKLVKGKE
jgi:hypothetical protein